MRIYRVSGMSMLPSMAAGDLLLVVRPPSRLSRGDLVIVVGPGDPGGRYVKRVVGLPEEEVRLSDGVVFVDDRELPEPYLGGLPASPGLAQGVWHLGQDEYFVMGDNRAYSTDSREFGPISCSQIIGRPRFRFWPPSRWGRV